MYKYKNNTIPNNKSNPLFKIPVTIDFIKLFKENGISKEEKHIPKYEYFVSVIYSEQLEQLTYVPVSNAVLRKVVRQPIITRMKDNLFSMGVVECNYKMQFEIQNGKTIGLEPYGYRITSKYYTPHSQSTSSTHNTPHIYNRSGFSDEKINMGRDAFSKKVSKALRTRWDDFVNLPQKPEYKFIRENSLKLEIEPSVYNWIDSQVQAQMKLRPAKVEFINGNGKLVSYLKKDRVLDAELGEDWKQHAKKIEAGIYKFSCPASVNRVYYPVTSMPSLLRNFFRYQGKALVQLDYSNFQPFLFIKFLTAKYKNDLPLDVVRYIDLTSKGVFYAEVKKIITDNNIEIKDEQSFKFDFFKRVFFSSERRNDKYRTAFAKEFPSVSAVITEIKKDNYKALSINLQRLEAEIVINTILREIATKYPMAFVLPVHDALICEESITATVEQLMLGKAKEIIGFEPKVKQELLIQAK